VRKKREREKKKKKNFPWFLLFNLLLLNQSLFRDATPDAYTMYKQPIPCLSKNGILSLVPCTGKFLCLLATPGLFFQKLVAWKSQYLKT